MKRSSSIVNAPVLRWRKNTNVLPKLYSAGGDKGTKAQCLSRLVNSEAIKLKG